MRITGGLYRGRPLIGPDDQAVRPTSDRARLAIFNMLISRQAVMDAIVLDLFCGTGALGLEAISRGARQAVLIDINPAHINIARENAKTLGADNKTLFLTHNATAVPPRPNHILPSTLVFLDPPYGKNMIPPTLMALAAHDWMAPQAWVVIETENAYTPPLPPGYILETARTYGAALITLAHYNQPR
jgi:16S rRNA (guanine966-N2)-methyltransferase